MKIKFLITLIVLIHFFNAFAQTEKNKTYWQINLQYGFIFEQEPFYQMMAPAHVKGLSLEYGFLPKGNLTWQKVHRFPDLGFGVHYLDLANPDVLGHAYSFFGFIKYRAFKKQPKWLVGNGQFGLAYVSRKFDVDENIYNLSIGSKVNVYGNVSADGQIKISPNLYWQYSLGLTHYSNGSFSTPNLGLNIISVRTGMRFNLYDVSPDYSKIEQPAPFSPHHSFLLSTWSGIREEYPVDSAKYFSTVLSFNYQFAPNYDKKIGIGADFMYEQYIKRKIVRLKIKEQATTADLFRAGIYVSYDFVFGKFQLFTHIGSYLYNQLTGPTKFLYERVGLNYALTPKLKASIMLKLHYVEADYFAGGFAYEFGHK